MAFEALLTASVPSEPLLASLHAAALKRRSLFEDSDVVRLHDADADAVGDVHIERYGDFAVLSAYSQAAVSERLAYAKALLALGARGVYYKERARADLRRKSTAELAPTAPLLGQAAPDEFVVREGPLRFWVRLADGLSTGLFLDQRDNRRRLFADCRGQQVLNLFAYNCSFSVAAGAGGAERVTSVDLSGAALARGDKNLVLNGLEPSQHRLLKADARKWLERAVRRQEPYDWIVLDPPVFASVGSDTFSVERDYQALATSALQLLRTGGRLLAVLNHRGTSARDHSAWVRAAAVSAGKSISKLEALVPPSDCAAEGVSVTKNLLLQVS